jgi:hypothetical protein
MTNYPTYICIWQKNCNFEPSCFLINCVNEKIKILKHIEIPYLLTVLLKIPLNKLPWSLYASEGSYDK